uniref:Protein kinase domain-containing protein n=1 Tax=Oryzias latipes TaxID=8090 RepID=A0A3P9KGQ0_ORYLA
MTRESPESDASTSSRYIPLRESPEAGVGNLFYSKSHLGTPLMKRKHPEPQPVLTSLYILCMYILFKGAHYVDRDRPVDLQGHDSLPLFLHEIRAIAWQLLISLKGLKSINLVHCDIKLDNIMLVNQVSEPFRVKLIDFGLASKTTDIQMGTRLQNICFRAPEVILGLPLDERLDMWTVGYVLALLYTDVYYKQTKIKEVDPNKRISPNDALRHPFFNLEKKTPKTSKPQKPVAVEVHQQPEAKEVPSVPQGPAPNPQERSSNKNKKSLVQQQKAEKRKAPAASRKRTNSDRQSQDAENSWQMEAAVKKKRKS